MGIDVHERNTLPNKERKMAASIGRTMKAYLVGRMTGQLHLDKILTDIRTRLFNSAKEGLLAKNIQKFEMVLRAAMSAHANRIIETTFHKFEKSTPAHKELWTTALGAILYVFGRQPQDDQVSKAVLQEIVCREQRTLDAVKGPEHQELSSKYFLEQLLIQHGCAEISLNSNLSEKFRRKKPLHLAAPETFDELEAGSSHLSWEAKDANTAKPLVHSRLSTRRYEDISLMRRLLIAIAYTQGFVRDGEVPHSVVGELIKRAKLHAFRVDGHLFGVARERLFELLQDGRDMVEREIPAIVCLVAQALACAFVIAHHELRSLLVRPPDGVAPHSVKAYGIYVYHEPGKDIIGVQAIVRATRIDNHPVEQFYEESTQERNEKREASAEARRRANERHRELQAQKRKHGAEH
eukprot:m.149868 g.149868  ORF g.149868 m.149868 type:complete len:408 (-) comp10139_c0_seq2:143-1366(-)